MVHTNFYKDIETPYTDKSVESTYFAIKDFPSYITAGKNHFLIAGTELLQPGTDVSIQILDSQDNIVEYDIPDILIDGTHRIVVMSIPSDVAYGNGSVTILGKTRNSTGTIYDVKWIRNFLINPTLENQCTPIFVENPTITVEEIYDSTQDISNIKYTQTVYSTGLLYSVITGLKESPNSKYTIYSSGSLANFDLEMVGGTLSISAGNIIPTVGQYETKDYVATITDVYNPTTISVDVPCVGTNVLTGISEKFEFKDAVYTITYAKKETFDAKNIRHSYLKLNLKNLNVYSGKAKYVDLYKEPGNLYLGRYELTSEYLYRTKFESVTDFTDNFSYISSGDISEIVNNKISNTVMHAN